MREITVSLGDRSYPIYIGSGLILNPDLYAGLLNSRQIMVVTDTKVEKLHLQTLLQALQQFDVKVHTIPEGEVHKNLETMNGIITALLKNRFARTSCLVAFGGGVVGDITGFTAACFQRGIRFIQVPTTLLAQVDSSVGGKTAVNHEFGKNMIGAFHQPAGVIADVSVLQTLPGRELSAGLAEVIKYGLIRDREFYDWLEVNMDRLIGRDPDALEYAIERSCFNKAAVVAEDETETGVRATLNLGHTFGHAVETGLHYKHWLHGEAVGLGMLMAAHMSMLSGWMSSAACERIRALLVRAGLLGMEQLRECTLFNEQYEIVNAKWPELDAKRSKHELIRRMINRVVDDLIGNSRETIRLQNPRGIEDVRTADSILISLSEGIRQQHLQLKQFLFHNLYRHDRVMQMTENAARIVTRLFDTYMQDVSTLPEGVQAGIAAICGDDPGRLKARLIADYIAGMTDRFAINESGRLS